MHGDDKDIHADHHVSIDYDMMMLTVSHADQEHIGCMQ